MTLLKAQAIQTALMGDWQAAVTINKTLLAEDPDDIDTLNRLAFAFASLGNSKEAKNLYQKVLSLDMQNPIALRNLKRLNGSSPTKKNYNGFSAPRNNLFIEESGKTKVVELINIADKKIITQLRSGEVLSLSAKRMKIFVLDQQKQYVGMLPDDLSKRLIEFISGGNEYEAYIRTVDSNRVTIFIRELKRATRFQYQPSFMSTDKAKLNFEHNTKHFANSKEKADNDPQEDNKNQSADSDDES